jgi:antitoxin YefM
MQEMTVSQFRFKLTEDGNMILNDHEPLRIIQENGDDFIIISTKGWNRYEETFYVLQNPSLMKQIGESLKTHLESKGYIPDEEDLYAINCV